MITVSDLSRRLAERTLAVCNLLIPGGRQVKNEYVCGDINGGEGDSLKVNLDGAHPGKWRDWANQEHHGDLLDLWRIRRGVSPGEAIRQTKEWLGISDPKAAQQKTYAKAPEKPYKAPSPEGRVVTWFKEKRGIPANVLDSYRVTLKLDEPKMIVFPCYSPTGELINRSYRSIPKDGEKKQVFQDKGCAPSLFGWQALSPNVYEQREILLCEGQIDAMTWAVWGFPVLSVPNGSGLTWVDYEWDNLNAFERIYLAFDMDDAGREICRKTVQRLGAHRCFIVEMPRKDANDCLLAGYTRSDAGKWVAAAKIPEFTGIVVGSDLCNRISADLAVKEKPFTLNIFDTDWSLQKGLYFRSREVTIWTGTSFAGKSTLLNWIESCAICKGMTVFIASMEVRVETTVKKMAHACLASEGEQRSEDNYLAWIKLFGHRIILSDIVGYIQQDLLFDQMQFAFQRYGVTQFFIDSLMRIEGLEEDYPAQGKFLNKLQEFAKTTGTHIHLVAHPGKSKDRKVVMMDVKGSTLLINNADNVVVVTRNREKDEILKERDLSDDEQKMHDSEVTVEKQREGGWVGTFYLRFNRHDCTFFPCDKWSPPKPDKPRKQWGNPRY